MSGTTPGTPRVLRAMNDRAALELLLEHGPLTRGRIGRLTGLSKPTASGLLSRLQAAGLVVVSGTSTGRPGPSAQLYALNPTVAHVAALDVTTARTRAAVADITGRTVGRFELPNGAGAAGDSVPEQVVTAVGGAAADSGLPLEALHRVVIGTPGAFDPRTGRLRYASHLPGWHGATLLEELAAALPVPLDYDNDVNLAAIAERHRGAARGQEDFVLLWNEEGIGAALVLGGRLHRGWTGGAGEVGFLPVPGVPLARQVARAGCGGFQELAGSGALVALARDLGVAPVAAGRSGTGARNARRVRSHGQRDADVVAEVLREAAQRVGTDGVVADDPYGEFLRTVATGVATGLAAMVAVLDPELIVLAGGLHLAGGEPLRALIQRELAELAAPNPRVVLSEITEQPVLSGALESALASTRDEVFDTSRCGRASPAPANTPDSAST